MVYAGILSKVRKETGYGIYDILVFCGILSIAWFVVLCVYDWIQTEKIRRGYGHAYYCDEAPAFRC